MIFVNYLNAINDTTIADIEGVHDKYKNHGLKYSPAGVAKYKHDE